MSDDDRTRRPVAGRKRYAHPLLKLLRCPQCHRLLVGKAEAGYICPQGARGKNATDACLPIFTVRSSSAEAALRELLPLLEPRLVELRDAARASLKRRNDGGFDIRLSALANEERAILGQIQALAAQGVETPESFTERLVALAGERQRVRDEQNAAEQVAAARVEAERVLAGLEPDEILGVLGKLPPQAYAEVLRAFFEWIEVRPLGAGHVGGVLLAYKFHNEQTSGPSSLMEHLARLLAA